MPTVAANGLTVHYDRQGSGPPLVSFRSDHRGDVEIVKILRAGPDQPVDAFRRQADAVVTHDGRPLLSRIAAPTLVTFGREDRLTSTRFAPALTAGIGHAEVAIFDGCAHAAISEDTAAFNRVTLDFPLRHRALR